MFETLESRSLFAVSCGDEWGIIAIPASNAVPAQEAATTNNGESNGPIAGQKFNKLRVIAATADAEHAGEPQE